MNHRPDSFEDVRLVNREKGAPRPEVLPEGPVTVYIGKYAPPRGLQKVIPFLMERPDGVYTPQFLRRIYEYLGTLPQDKPVRIVLGDELGSFLNGNYLEGLPRDELLEELHKIATARKVDDSAFEYVSFEKLHPELFDRLYKSVENEELQIDKIFDPNVELETAPNAYEIASFLYHRSLSEQKLHKAILRCTPGKLRREKRERPYYQEELYGLCEISMRLCDLINGRNIQAGADRQNVYDDVIEDLVAGSKGPLKGANSLDPLFKILEDKPFHTVHFHKKENPHLRRLNDVRRWTRAESRKATALAAAAGTLLAIWPDMHDGPEAPDAVEEWGMEPNKMVDIVSDQKCYGPDPWMYQKGPESTKNKVYYLDQLVEEAHGILTQDYGMQTKAAPSVMPLLEAFLGNDSIRKPSVCDTVFPRYATFTVDQFVHHYTPALEQFGLNTSPYGWDHNKPSALQNHGLQNELLIPSVFAAWGKGGYRDRNGAPLDLRSFGDTFFAPSSLYTGYHTTEFGPEISERIRERVQLAALTQFDYGPKMFSSWSSEELKLVVPETDPRLKPAGVFVDPIGTTHYELATIPSKFGFGFETLLARRPGESDYTGAAAEDFREFYDEIVFGVRRKTKHV